MARFECYLHTLSVVKKYRRRGIARALTEAASAEAGVRGRRTLIIGVDRPNEYALGLYKKWGFIEFHESSDLRGDSHIPPTPGFLAGALLAPSVRRSPGVLSRYNPAHFFEALDRRAPLDYASES